MTPARASGVDEGGGAREIDDAGHIDAIAVEVTGDDGVAELDGGGAGTADIACRLGSGADGEPDGGRSGDVDGLSEGGGELDHVANLRGLAAAACDGDGGSEPVDVDAVEGVGGIDERGIVTRGVLDRAATETDGIGGEQNAGGGVTCDDGVLEGEHRRSRAGGVSGLSGDATDREGEGGCRGHVNRVIEWNGERELVTGLVTGRDRPGDGAERLGREAVDLDA